MYTEKSKIIKKMREREQDSFKTSLQVLSADFMQCGDGVVNCIAMEP